MILYRFFKLFAFVAIKIFCRKTVVNFDDETTFSKPKIIACNHPNSFFDAICIAVHYPKPIYFLARGDAFKNPFFSKILNALHLIPIYRMSEGRNNLSKNEMTFKKCLQLLHENETILIFSEGICVNEWNLRDLKKGTARLAKIALNAGISDIKIQPTNINYSSFKTNPEKIILNFNQEFEINSIDERTESDFYKDFSKKLEIGILNNMIIHENGFVNSIADISNLRKLKKILLLVPAAVGYVLNFGFYSVIKTIAHRKTTSTVFYHSALFGLLLICYPIFVTIISTIIFLYFGFKIAILTFILFPVSAFLYKEYKS